MGVEDPTHRNVPKEMALPKKGFQKIKYTVVF